MTLPAIYWSLSELTSLLNKYNALNKIIKCLNQIISENRPYNLHLFTFTLYKFQEKNLNLNRDSSWFKHLIIWFKYYFKNEKPFSTLLEMLIVVFNKSSMNKNDNIDKMKKIKENHWITIMEVIDDIGSCQFE